MKWKMARRFFDFACPSHFPVRFGARRGKQNRGALLPGSTISHVWWRWRESNPRPKQSPVGIYRLILAYESRPSSSHEEG